MTVTATDTPAVITISQDGAKGDKGDPGDNGSGLNVIRYNLLSSPASALYGVNTLVRLLGCFLTVARTSSGDFTDIYGAAQTAADDVPREESKGWLINGDEVHTFNSYNNIPEIDNGYSLTWRIGSYSESSPSQKLITIPAESGDALSVGTDGSGNWVATVQGDNTITYQATTSVSATSASDAYVTVTFGSGILNIYVNGDIEGTVTVPTGNMIGVKPTGVTSISGDFTANLLDLRQYNFVLNNDEILYLT